MSHRFLIPLALALTLMTSSAVADDGAPEVGPTPTPRWGDSMLDLFECLTEEMRPRFEDLLGDVGPTLEGLLQDMGPALNGLAEMIGDLNAYHPPERLPNGDIILRRKTPVPPEPPKEQPTEPTGPIDL